jgi:hypothetical protein
MLWCVVTAVWESEEVKLRGRQIVEFSGDTTLSLVQGWVICQWGNFDSANVDVQNERSARDA